MQRALEEQHHQVYSEYWSQRTILFFSYYNILIISNYSSIMHTGMLALIMKRFIITRAINYQSYFLLIFYSG